MGLPAAPPIEGASRRSLARDPALQVLAFIAFSTILKCVVASQVELDSVEAYHWLYARNPALGYFDHPGMIGWMIWLSTALFGDSALGVRMSTILAGALTIWLAFLAGRKMYGERAGRLAALLVGLTPMTVKLGFEAGPDAPLLLFWTAALWALAHALDGGRWKWWLVAGAFCGGALLSKYTAVFLPVGVLLFLLLSPEHRPWLRRPHPYAAALVALAVFSPALAWNAQNGWASFAYQGVERLGESSGMTVRYLDIYARRQLLLVTPFVLAWGYWFGFRPLWNWRASSSADRLNASIGMPILGLFAMLCLFRSVRAHWPAPGYISVFLLAASAVTAGGLWGRRLHHLTLAALAVAGLTYPVALARMPREQLTGWAQVASEVQRLHPDFVIAQDYHVAAQMAYHLRPLAAWDMTPVGLGGKSFRFWWRPGPFASRDALVIYHSDEYPTDLDRVIRSFERVEDPVQIAVTRLGGRKEKFFLIWARSYHAPGDSQPPSGCLPP